MQYINAMMLSILEEQLLVDTTHRVQLFIFAKEAMCILSYLLFLCVKLLIFFFWLIRILEALC